MGKIPSQIFSSLISELFDLPIMGNLYRPHYVERMVAIGLGDGFKLVSANWAGWDIESNEGVRVEVKQSAALQTWTENQSGNGKTTKGSFDIAPRKGYFTLDGGEWISQPGRLADIYILAWHPVVDQVEADHRDHTQWLFFVVPSEQLPQGQKRMSRTVVERKWPAVTFEELRNVTLNTIKRLPLSPPQTG